MEDLREHAPPAASQRWSRAEIVYAVALFVAAAVGLAFAIASRGAGVLPDHEPRVGLFFLCYGLFTIAIGYQHPTQGYYSFDRVSQVASVLVLGPVDAAWINGLASLLYPWHRLWKGVPLPHVVYASLNNAGLMTAIILLAGHLYTAVGGAVPLLDMSGWAAVELLLLVLAMQVLNDAGMLGLQWVGRRDIAGFFNGFSYALELGSGATAVLVALVYNAMDTEVLVLLLGVLSLGMLALQRFADMRQKLELIVEERTRSLREKTRELEEQATRDNLTGLFNRRYADQYVAEQLESARRHGQAFAVAFADIDFFKRINDQHSHATGDVVLKRVAEIFAERCRKTDMVSRYGGEEFLICFPYTDLHRAQVLCERLRSLVEDTDWPRLGVAVTVTVSFGIAEYRGDATPDDLLDRADRQLYAAKNGGRNRVVA
ncbi:MAG TPA: GGDEF domain-containing protein [Gammaproteobacteria bacterium]